MRIQFVVEQSATTHTPIEQVKSWDFVGGFRAYADASCAVAGLLRDGIPGLHYRIVQNVNADFGYCVCPGDVAARF